MENFLEAKGIVKRFANHVALDGANIAVKPGRIFGLLGPNGAGKTTLIRIINRITMPDEGEVIFNGRPMQADDVFRIGYLPEERGLYKKMKVGEQAIFLARLKGLDKQTATRRLHEWFDKFGIMPWWNRKLEELSKGMQQKVQFVITVLHEPELLIFDEPFSGFDPVNAELLKKEILELKQKGHTIVFSTHNMNSVEEICDDIALINHSKVVLNGKVNEVRSRFSTGIYQLVTTGERRLQPSDDIELKRSLAAIASIRDTWAPDTDYSQLVALAHEEIPFGPAKIQKDFIFPIHDDVVYYTLADIQSPEAKSYYEKAIAIKRQIQELGERLDGLRVSYTQGNAAKREQLTPAILQAEEQLDALLDQPKDWEKKARNAEIAYLRKNPK